MSPVSKKLENSNKKISLIGIVLGICMIAVVLVAYGQISVLQRNTTDLEASNDELLSQIADLQAERDALLSQNTSLTAEKTSLEAQVNSLEANVTTLNGQVAQWQGDNAALREQMTAMYSHIIHLELQTLPERLLARQPMGMW